MSYIASGGSQMPSFSPVFLNLPKHSFAALPLAFGPLALKLHWQILADIFKTYLPIGRLFSFSKCNPEYSMILCNLNNLLWTFDKYFA